MKSNSFDSEIDLFDHFKIVKKGTRFITFVLEDNYSFQNLTKSDADYAVYDKNFSSVIGLIRKVDNGFNAALSYSHVEIASFTTTLEEAIRSIKLDSAWYQRETIG